MSRRHSGWMLAACAWVGLIDPVNADESITVPVSNGTDVGVGFGELEDGAHTLEIVLDAGSETIRRSVAYDSSGTALWMPSEQNVNQQTHTYEVVGVTPNESHSIRFHGLLVTPGGVGTGADQPSFDVAVAYVDIDVNAEGPSGSLTEDENEVGAPGSGLEMPVTLPDGALPSVASDSNWFPLGVSVQSKVAGDLVLSVSGPGLGVYQPDGTLITGGIPVDEGSLEAIYQLRTNTQFTSEVVVTATFVPDSGTSSPIDRVAVFPTLEAGMVNLTMDANRDGALGPEDDLVEDQGVIVFSKPNTARLHVFGMDLVGYDLRLQTANATFTPNGSGTAPDDETEKPWTLGSGDPNTHFPNTIDVFADSVDMDGNITLELIGPAGQVVHGQTLALLAPTLIKFLPHTGMEFLLGGGTANSAAGTSAGGTTPDSGAKVYPGQEVAFRIHIKDVDQYQTKAPGEAWSGPIDLKEKDAAYIGGFYVYTCTMSNATIESKATSSKSFKNKSVSNIPVVVDADWAGNPAVSIHVKVQDYQRANLQVLEDEGFQLAEEAGEFDLIDDSPITKTITWTKATSFPRVATGVKQAPAINNATTPFRAYRTKDTDPTKKPEVTIWYAYGPDLPGSPDYAGVTVSEHFSKFTPYYMDDTSVFKKELVQNDPGLSPQALADSLLNATTPGSERGG